MPPTNLPTIIAPGDPGHIGHHQTIHGLLNNIDAPVAIAGDVTAANLAALEAITPSAAGTYGWLTDRGRLYRWNGSAWKLVSTFDIINLRDFIEGDGVTNDAAAYQAGLNLGVTLERPVYHPADLVAYMGTTELSMGEGLMWFGDGYGSMLLSDAAGTYCFAKNAGWSTSTPVDRITVRGLRLRREVALAGNEGPYDGCFQFRLVDTPDIRDIWQEGGMAGIRFEGCTNPGWDNLNGYRQGDGSLRFSHFAGNDRAEGCRPGISRSQDAGYQLLTGAAVPEPDGPIGSAFLATQDNVSMGTLISIDPRYNNLEIGNGLFDLDIDKILGIVTTAGRSSKALLANYDGVHIGSYICKHYAVPGNYGLVSQGNGVDQVQRNLTVGVAVGYNRSGSTTAQSCVVQLGTDTVRPHIGKVTGYDMQAIASSGAGGLVGITDVEIDEAYSYGARRAGVNLAHVTRLSVGKIRTIGCGTDATVADPKQRSGILIDSCVGTVRLDDIVSELNAGYGMYNNATDIEAGPVGFPNNVTGDYVKDGAGGKLVGSFTGTGTPEGAVKADIGSRYRRKDGGAATSLYVKESGAGTNTGWVAK